MAFYFYCYVCEISLICFLSSFVLGTSTPTIDSADVINETVVTDKNVTVTKVFLRLHGEHLGPDTRIRPSLHVAESGSECSNDELSHLEFAIEWSNETSSVVSIESDSLPLSQFALCVLDVARTSELKNPNRDAPKWLNQGSGALFRTSGFSDSEDNSLMPAELANK